MQLKQYLETNTVSLGLIPIQSKLPPAYHRRWESVEGDEKNGRGIVCWCASDIEADEKAGISRIVPHGFSGDILTAFMTLALAKNTDGVNRKIETDRQEVLRLIGVEPSQHSYAMVDQYFWYLEAAKYAISNSWQTPLQEVQHHVSLSLLDHCERIVIKTFERRSGEKYEHVRYRVKLNDLIWTSAQAGTMLSLNPQILAQMESPTGRGLYRVLEAERHHLQETTDSITLYAKDLLEATRTLSRSKRESISDRLVTLTRKGGGFEQLVKANYLERFDSAGRGDNTILRLYFKATHQPISTVGEQLLIERGVTANQARALAIGHSTENIECAIWMTDEEKKMKVLHNEAGFIIHLLKTGGVQKKQLDDYRNHLKARQYVTSPAPVREVKPAPELEALPDGSERLKSHSSFLLAIKKVKPQIVEELLAAVEAGHIQTDDLSPANPLIRNFKNSELEENLRELLSRLPPK